MLYLLLEVLGCQTVNDCMVELTYTGVGSGITRVFFGSDFVTVTKSDDATWDFLKPEIFAAIMDFYSSGKPLFLDSTTAASMDTAIHEVLNSELSLFFMSYMTCSIFHL